MPSEKELVREIAQHASDLARAAATAEACYERYTQEVETELQSRLAAIQSEHDAAVERITTEYSDVVKSVRQELDEVKQACGLWGAPWDHPDWQTYAPDPQRDVPRLTRLGQLSLVSIGESGQEEVLTTPALLPVVAGKNVVVKASGAAKARAAAAAQSVALRLLATVPPGGLRLLLIDPVGLGQNVAGFMHLADHMPDLAGGKAWTEPRHIEQRLADLSAHMEMVIQKYLRNRYATMEDYNAEAGEVAEPYRLLVIMNFPVNFSEEAARRLLSIAGNGPRCGVYVLVTIDSEHPLPRGFNLADLERSATVIAWDGKRFVWEDEDSRHAHLDLDIPPSADEFERIVRATGAAAEKASRVEVPFNRVIPRRHKWWQESTLQGISVPIGRVGAHGTQHFALGQGTTQHALVAGRTGSGKSNFMHVLITSLAITYPPDELELHLVDFKKGVEFKPYATHQLPHARVVAIESEREFGVSVLQGLDAELQRRGEAFRQAGANDLEEYRSKTAEQLPRILLVVDEFQEFFTRDDRLATEASLILDRMARQGRAFGIHILLGSQTLHGAYSLARSTMDQMAVRIALQCSDTDSRLILADDNPAARLLSRPGEAIYNAANGLIEGNTLFQIAWLPDEDREQYPQRVRGLAESQGLLFQPPVVFEGNEPACLEKNQPLQQLLEQPAWPEPGRSAQAWLGEPVAIRPPTAASLRRQAGSNLLVLGRDEGTAVGILSAAVISLAVQYRPDQCRVEIVDLTTYDAPWAEAAETLADVLPHPIQVHGRRDVGAILGEISDLVDQRLREEQPSGPAVFLVIQGLQRARDLRREEGVFFPVDEEPLRPAHLLERVLKDGPEADIHVLAWCDTFASLTNVVDRRCVAEFGARVALPMSAEDSSNVLDDPAAAKLDRPNRALLYDEERVGRLEKFRPYQVPEAGWLLEVGKALRAR